VIFLYNVTATCLWLTKLITSTGAGKMEQKGQVAEKEIIGTHKGKTD
jgi:hypothetical protein